jgi:hypothetical protein
VNRGVYLVFLQPRRYMGVSGQRHAPGRFTPGNTPVPIVQEAGPGWSGRVRKISHQTGFRSPDPLSRIWPLHRLQCPGPRVKGFILYSCKDASTPCRLHGFDWQEAEPRNG